MEKFCYLAGNVDYMGVSKQGQNGMNTLDLYINCTSIKFQILCGKKKKVAG